MKSSIGIARSLSVGVTAFLIMAWAGSSVVAQTTTPLRRVLVLYSDERLLPANIIADEAIRATFAAESSNPIEFHSEFLDVSRFPGEPQQQRERDFLRDKYRDRPPDLVIAGGGPSLEFLLKYRAVLFAEVPIVHCAVDALPKEMPDTKIVGIPMLRAAASTLELALSLQPDTRNVAVVAGGAPQDLESAEQFRKETPAFADRVAFTWLINLSMSDLRAELSRLPGRTVVLYLTMFQDATGASFVPRQALALFAPASRAPIYGCYDTYLGYGVVGGSMVTFEEIGRKAARMGIRILEGEEAQTIARSEFHQAAPMFDWRQLRQWSISEKRLPPGSVIRFREPTYWEQNNRLILGAVSLCTVQALMIGALLIQRRRLRLAQRSLCESEQRMSLAADAANLGIWIRDFVGDQIWATDKWRQLFGFEKWDWLDMPRFLQRLHPEDRDAVSKALTMARETGGIYEKEFRIVLPDGRVRWIASRGRVEFDAAGKPVFMRGAALDNTARKLAEEAAHDLSGRLIHAQEEEQTRLARELHDDLSQSLALLSVELEIFGQNPPHERGQISGRMQEFSADVKRLSSEVHRLSHELHPAKLEQLGLVAAIRGFCKELAMAHEMAIEFADRSVPRAVPEDTALCLYRITQEALHNVIKHSGGTVARVQLTRNDGELRLVVADDGVGFDPETVRINGSLGLVSMAERARFVHGRFSIESHAGKGTRIDVHVPIAAVDDFA
ncbi:MAG: ABC transporter substrate binding protein [Terrimicrobiaceae bacterium]